MTTCLVYLLTNRVNGKWYVGKTKRKAQARWRQHVSSAINGAPWSISAAIRKYGESNFDLEVICSELSWNQACVAEKEWIRILRSHEPKFGYNLTLGGDGVEHNEATRQKVSKTLKGRVILPEWRKKMSDTRKKNLAKFSVEDGDFSFRKDISNPEIARLYLQEEWSLPE